MPTTTRTVFDISVPALPTNQHMRAAVTPTNSRDQRGSRETSLGLHTPADISLRQAALVGGLGLLLLAVLAAIANFGVLKTLIVPSDANTTAEHIAAASGLFRLAIGAFFAVAILDVVVAWALYIVLRPVNRSLSLLAALFRVVYATLLAVAVNNLLNALSLLGAADFLNAFGTDQLHAQMMLLLGAFQSGWDLSLIVFGLHLFMAGMLVFGSGKRLRVLGLLVIAAGLGYLIDGCGKLLVPDYGLTVAVYTFVGEPLLIFWLLWKGIRGVDTKRAPAS